MSTRAALTMSFVIFIAIGLLSAALGPALPDLADRAGRDLATLGSLVTMVWSGTLVAHWWRARSTIAGDSVRCCWRRVRWRRWAAWAS